jgi:hypothetical protein
MLNEVAERHIKADLEKIVALGALFAITGATSILYSATAAGSHFYRTGNQRDTQRLKSLVADFEHVDHVRGKDGRRPPLYATN